MNDVEIFCPSCGTLNLAKAPDFFHPDYHKRTHNCIVCGHRITDVDWFTKVDAESMMECLEMQDGESITCKHCGHEATPSCQCGFCDRFEHLAHRINLNAVAR